MMYLLKLLLYCFCLSTLNVRALKADGSFEDADQVNEFITMSFSTSHPYDLRQTIPGEPEIDYPIYSAVPKTNFDCNGRHEGYYADTEARCQVFRICANTDLVGKGFAFLCPNGTLFSQKNFVCDWYRNVDCNDSERFYSKNDNNRIGTKTHMMKTVRQMMEHPMKTISIALNRGKSTTRQPTASTNTVATIPAKPNTKFQTSSSSPASNIPNQDNFDIENQSVNTRIKLNESASGFTLPSQETSNTGEAETFTTSGPGQGFKPSNAVSLAITPPSPTFSPPFKTPLPTPSENNDSFGNYNPLTQTGPPLSYNEDNSSEKKVYISSLGELSTDPGVNFNRQTSRVIADSPSNALENDTKPSNILGLNFAEIVNAGLNGVHIVSRDAIIAPEYVKNIMQNNVGLRDDKMQPVSYDFASNINSLLDEVNYEAQLEAQNSLQFQQPPQNAVRSATKKPFRFLSRGFSHEKSKDDGSYAFGRTSSPRRSYHATQHSTSTQSYSNSLLTTLLTNTQPPVTSTEATQVLELEHSSENQKNESAVKLNKKLEVHSFESKQTITLADDTNKSSLLDTSKQEKLTDSHVENKPEIELEPKLLSKSAIKREPKDLKQLDTVDSLKDLSQELKDEDKVNANKRAEDLLLAGVKQITVNEPEEKIKTTDEGITSPIVPIYNRVTAPQTSTPHITSSTITSTLSTTTTLSTNTESAPSSTEVSSSTDISSTTDVSSSTDLSSSTDVSGSTDFSSSTMDILGTSPAIPTDNFSTTLDPTTTAAVPIRRFTIGSGKQRQISRPISSSRRRNLQRSGPRTNLNIKSANSTVPNYKGRLGVGSTSTTSAPNTNTTKIITAPRKRLNANAYVYGSRRRTTESTSSTTSSTTTIAPPSKKLNVRRSDSAFSDLTGAASTYNNAVSNRLYKSFRQSSDKYTQIKRRRPIHKNVTSETITTKPTLKTSTMQQPRSSSSYPTSTLAPFSHHEALSPMPTSSTTPEPLPATFLSFNDLTKSITDDSILQTLRKNQALNKPLNDLAAFTIQQKALPSQQIAFSNLPRIQQEHSVQKLAPVTTSLPFIPLKDFIASKFGPQYSPEPPKLSTARPVLITPSFNNDFVLKAQKKPIFEQQYQNQQYGDAHHDFLPLTNPAVKLSTPVQYTERTPLNQNGFQQQSQLSIQQRQKQELQQQQQPLKQQQQPLVQPQQYQYPQQQQQHHKQQPQQHQHPQQLQQNHQHQPQQHQHPQQLQQHHHQQQHYQQQIHQQSQQHQNSPKSQQQPQQQPQQHQNYQQQKHQLSIQQHQQKLQQLKQQQNHLQQQYQHQQNLQQQQKLQQQQQQQQHQISPKTFFSINQQQIFPNQQYISQLQQTVPTLEQNTQHQTQQQQLQQGIPIQQHINSVHQVSTKIIPSIEQFQIQLSQQIHQPTSVSPQQQQSPIQIIPSKMTIAQTIPPQQPNIHNMNFNSNIKSEIGSINVRLPSNHAGLIPNTSIFDSSRSSNSLEIAQRRSDQSLEDAYGSRERKSVFAGVSSYDVPLSSVGRLTNDITDILRQRRL